MLQAKDLEEKLAQGRQEAEENDAKRRAEKSRLPYLNLISAKVPTEIRAMELVSKESARSSGLVPLQINPPKSGSLKKGLVLAVFDPQQKETKDIIEKLEKEYSVNVIVVSKSSLEHAWKYYEYVVDQKEISGRVELNEENLKSLAGKIKKLGDLGEIIQNFKGPNTSQVLETILAGALTLKASDIHLEPDAKKNSFRLRIDGLLHAAYEGFSKEVYKSVITRVKLLSNLKLNIQDEPQDGRFTIKMAGRDIEIRTSIIPSEYGETSVLRVLDPSSLKINLEELGLRPDDLEIIKTEVAKPNGLILNTGPTGSGKTTTLYAFLRKVFEPEIKIITIEDPIEYHLPGISQTQVDPSANYTFASGLRSILRQDPDIVLVGEIRDKETAEIALNASLTGHLVLSTLHTNDAVGAIPRLIDLGAKPQILGPGLNLIIAQRLVRLLCPDCKKEKRIEEKLMKKLEDFLKNLPNRVSKDAYKKPRIFEASGCSKCADLGYKGRISIFELFVVSEKIEEAIYKNPTEIEIKNLAKNQGMVTMQEDGVLKMLQGLTSLSEIERLTGAVPWLH